jgi:lipopolysaccharide export system protein LptC
MATATPTTRWLAVAALAGLAGASWWLSREATLPAVSRPVARHEPDYIVERFTATVMDETGRPRYRLSAERLVRFADDGSHELEKPHLVQYGNGVPTHTRAARGWMPADRSVIEMRGSVRMARGQDPKGGAGGEIRADTMRIRLDN